MHGRRLFHHVAANRLTFSIDTLSLDTTFANVPTTTHSFWAYNRSGEGLRCASVRLASGNQTGFRVNVNGTYLGPTLVTRRRTWKSGTRTASGYSWS